MSAGVRPPRDVDELAAGVRRMIRSLAARVALEDPDGLVHLDAIVAEAKLGLRTAIEGQRRHHTDRDIGAALGVSRQAIEQRYPRVGAYE